MSSHPNNIKVNHFVDNLPEKLQKRGEIKDKVDVLPASEHVPGVLTLIGLSKTSSGKTA